MSDSEDVRLPKAAEALLEDWPAPERDEQFWDDNAKQVMVKAETADPTSAALFDAPLPAEEGEPGTAAEPEADVAEEAESVEPIGDEASEVEPDEDQELPTMPRASDPPPRASTPPPAREGLSLAEMARLSLEEEKKQPDSKDIARESLSLASRSRASVPDLADAIRASKPPPAPPSAAPESGPVSAEAKPAESASKPKSRMGPVLAIAGAAVGIAAAALILIRTQRGAEPSPLVQAPAAEEQAAAKSKADEPADLPVAKRKDDGTLSFDDLATEGAQENTPSSPGAAVGKVAGSAAKKTDEPNSKAEDEKSEDGPPKEQIVLAEEDEEGAKLEPAAENNDAPLEPGKGAVQAAIGSVLGGARACVAGHDAPSRATVTFGSSGKVSSVAVSGPAAGTPAEGCIRAALSQARVQPFQKPSYTAGLTIRPN